MPQLHTLRQKTHALNTEIYALYLSYRDSRVNWYVRVLLALAIGYGLSPIDLLPDLMPIFGYLDDVVIVAAGLRVSCHMLTKEVRHEAQLQAYEDMTRDADSYAVALKVVSYAWLLVFALLLLLAYKLLHMHML